MLELDTEHPSLVAGIFGLSLTIPEKSDFFLEIVNHCVCRLRARATKRRTSCTSGTTSSPGGTEKDQKVQNRETHSQHQV